MPYVTGGWWAAPTHATIAHPYGNRHLERQKQAGHNSLLQPALSGRGDRIRTYDLLTPSQTRYQTAPRPVTMLSFSRFLGACPDSRAVDLSGQGSVGLYWTRVAVPRVLGQGEYTYGIASPADALSRLAPAVFTSACALCPSGRPGPRADAGCPPPVRRAPVDRWESVPL